MPEVRTLLSSSDRAALEVSLGRLMTDALGALATLPLFCLGGLPADDPRAPVQDRYDVWRSCLIVAREVIRANAEAPESAMATVRASLNAAGDVRDAFFDIAESHQDAPAAAQAAFRRLSDAYDRLSSDVHELSESLGLEPSFLPAARSVRRVSFERSLRSLGEELDRRAHAHPAAPNGG